jgi:3-hydroxybutyryl-CoA dehydratase
MSEIRQMAINGLRENDTVTITRTFREADVERFADITLDYNPVHFEERFTRAKNLPGPICHGLLIGSMITQIGGQAGWLASRFDFSFVRPVFIGDTITCTLKVEGIDDDGRTRAKAVFVNQRNETVLESDLEGILPGEAEREVMRAMVAEGDPTNKLRG